MEKFNTLNEAKDYLISHGFKEYHDYLASPGVAASFQKRYDDELGKKYFINVDVWDWTYTNKIPENYVIEFNGQYYQKGTHSAVNFTFINWKLEQIENWLDSLFDNHLIEHYELWDEC